MSKNISKIIKVTQRDIDKGERGSDCRCPIALAIKKQFPKEPVRVNRYEVAIGEHSFITNRALEMFISDFDNRQNVLPFQFELSLKKGLL